MALTVALNHPDTISGIVTLAPLTHMEDEIRAEFKGLYITSKIKRWLIAQTTAVPASLKYAPQTLDFVFGPQKWPEDYIIAGGGMLGLRPSHFFATSSDIVAIEKDLRRDRGALRRDQDAGGHDVRHAPTACLTTSGTGCRCATRSPGSISNSSTGRGICCSSWPGSAWPR